MGNLLIGILSIALFGLLALYAGSFLGDSFKDRSDDAKIGKVLSDAALITGALATAHVDGRVLVLSENCDASEPDTAFDCLAPLLDETDGPAYLTEDPMVGIEGEWILTDSNDNGRPDSLIFTGLNGDQCLLANESIANLVPEYDEPGVGPSATCADLATYDLANPTNKNNHLCCANP
jgi:hypothetical protein